MREDMHVGEQLAKVARVLDSGDVCWSGVYVKQALRELAAANRIILGFDIIDFATDPPTDGDTSGYDLGADAVDYSWDECVKVSLEKALFWVDRTPQESLTPESVWYCVTSFSPEEARSEGFYTKADL
ncbi:MAG TPA: hypothetical protein VFE16_05445 [Candidatus Cybelea sp.]|jgi:hypothetical protein|nr:hypothetical protein [Candidatus Cybelea sp.]